jgi:hypothetical protein
MATSCGPSGQQRAAWEVDHRLEDRLAPDIAAGNATVQPLPDGAQVTLLNPAQLPSGTEPAGGSSGDIRAHVVQGLLNRRLMRIQLADTSPLPQDQQQAQVQNLTQYFIENRLGPTLQPAAPPQEMPPGPGGGAPAGLAITITVQCPQDHEGTAYDTNIVPPIDTDVRPASCR